MSTGQSSQMATIAGTDFLPPDVERAQAAISPDSPVADDGPVILYEGLEVHRFSVEQYGRMAECEILGPRERVFLLDGVVVRKMTMHPPHAIAMAKLNVLLARVNMDGWHLANQTPVVINPMSEPEPDFKIVRGTPDDYRRANPGARDTVLIIEVSDSSLRLDQTIMKARYAAAGIPAYWIINLPADRVEVYSEPTGPDGTPDYRRREEFNRGDSVPLVLDGREVARIAVADFLPRPLEDS